MTRNEALKDSSFEYYDEDAYISPENVSKETIARIKARKIGTTSLDL